MDVDVLADDRADERREHLFEVSRGSACAGGDLMPVEVDLRVGLGLVDAVRHCSVTSPSSRGVISDKHLHAKIIYLGR